MALIHAAVKEGIIIRSTMVQNAQRSATWVQNCEDEDLIRQMNMQIYIALMLLLGFRMLSYVS